GWVKAPDGTPRSKRMQLRAATHHRAAMRWWVASREGTAKNRRHVRRLDPPYGPIGWPRSVLSARQSNRLETDSSAAVRPIASPLRLATERVRILRATLTAWVGWIESVMTSSLRLEAVMRATAPPESTPWVI